MNPLDLPELEQTRGRMVEEFESEQAGNPYVPKNLSPAGLAAFPGLVRDAITSGSAETLAISVQREAFWKSHDVLGRQINIRQASERLALGELLGLYTRALAGRLLEEGVETCRVHRAAYPKWEPGECSEHEDEILSTRAVYDGYRAAYWPEPGRPDVLTVPFGPGCHHTIRRRD
jgi:hypothetical protein